MQRAHPAAVATVKEGASVHSAPQVVAAPPHEGSAGTQPLARRHARRISIVEGAGARLSEQTRLLLRTRLRLASLLVLIGSLIFLAWTAITGNLSLTRSAGYISWIHIAMVLTVGYSAYELWRPRLMTWRGLRIAEFAIFGFPALLILVVQYVQMARPTVLSRIPVSTGSWCALIFTYAMFVPNSWRRAARIMVPVALAPTVLSIVAYRDMAHPPTDFWEELSGVTLLLLLVAGVATYGTHVINALRRQAFEARQLGQYRLKELLGSGGMGDVWLAEHQLLKRPCAIKLIEPAKSADPRAQARFEREVRATAHLSHWNTVEIFDYGRTDNDTFYYVMEYLPGLSLAELVESHGPLPPERAVHLLRQCCEALREAHAQGLIHRDIKPGNIIAAYRGGLCDVAKILDFGLVELMRDPVNTWSGTTSFAGSPLYMSPEQALGSGRPDARSDIYSLGAVAYYLITGRPPFEGTKPIKVVIAHAHDPVPRPSSYRQDVPVDLEEIILTCLAKDPADRFQSAGDLEKALAACSAANRWTHDDASRWWQMHEPGIFSAAERGE